MKCQCKVTPAETVTNHAILQPHKTVIDVVMVCGGLWPQPWLILQCSHYTDAVIYNCTHDRRDMHIITSNFAAVSFYYAP